MRELKAHSVQREESKGTEGIKEEKKEGKEEGRKERRGEKKHYLLSHKPLFQGTHVSLYLLVFT